MLDLLLVPPNCQMLLVSMLLPVPNPSPHVSFPCPNSTVVIVTQTSSCICEEHTREHKLTDR